MISRVFPSKFQQICITSVSGYCAHFTFKVCQIVEGISTIRQFHEFFTLIFGVFLTFGPTVQRRAPPPFFHHYILFLCFSTKFWSSRLTRPTETRYYRAYITLHICVVVIKLVSFSKCLHNFYNFGPEKEKKKNLSALQTVHTTSLFRITRL